MSALARGGAIAGAIGGNALVQALLVAGDPVPGADPVFVLLVVASFAVLVVAVWAGLAVAAGRTLRGALPLLGAVALCGAALALAAVASAWLVAPVAALVVIILAPLADGARIGGGFRVFSGAPIRATASVLAVLVLCAVGWVGALLLGFFVTGPIASFLTWILYGVLAAAAFGLWLRLWRRDGSAASTPVHGGAADVPREAPIG